MKKILTICFAVFVCFPASIFAQIPTTISVQIVKAEDERRFDKTLEDFMKNPNEDIRIRAALAAGRIGDERAVPALTNLLENDSSGELREMAAFALGEIESIKAADAILSHLDNEKTAPELQARLTEAAGKIAAANAKQPKAIELGEAILDILSSEARKPQPHRPTVLLGLTAILRVKPEGGDLIAAKFLTNMDARIRADAANTLSRIRAVNASEQLRAMLLADDDAIVRANAARALGAAEDKAAFDLLLEAAIEDEDSRVRVSAIRSLGNLKDKRAADKLLKRGAVLLTAFKKSKSSAPVEKSELLEIATTLGRILPGAPTEKAVSFLSELREADNFQSPETEIALTRVFTVEYPVETPDFKKMFAPNANAAQFAENARVLSSFVQGFGEAANVPANENNKGWRAASAEFLRKFIQDLIFIEAKIDRKTADFVMPDAFRSYAAFKTDDLAQVLRGALKRDALFAPDPVKREDVFVRAAAAELLGETTASEETDKALARAFEYALKNDKQYNDAQLAILDAFAKLDKNAARGTLLVALHESDFLVRRKAIQLIRANNLANADDVGLLFQTETAEKERNTVRPFNEFSRSKQGVILNSAADYARAVNRKNARAILTTDKGTFTIDLFPEDAPLTIDNFIKLAKANYFNGLAIHRVVPNFVMQDGDPRGDGNGGPGWQIRDEMNMREYERGAVGMALSGKDTGGSQWFVTHAPQPHLDGGYTVFGRVNETGMKIVDNLVRGDKIRSVKIIENTTLRRK